MPLTDEERGNVARLRKNGLSSEWGARGYLEGLQRYGSPTPAEQADIGAALKRPTAEAPAPPEWGRKGLEEAERRFGKPDPSYPDDTREAS